MSIAIERHPILLPQQHLRPSWPRGRCTPNCVSTKSPHPCGGVVRRAVRAAAPRDPRRARVCHVAAGTRLAQRGDAAGNWVGVARGAVRLGTALSDGRNFTLDFIGPGQWFGDIALVDDRSNLDVVAHVPVDAADLAKPDLHALLELASSSATHCCSSTASACATCSGASRSCTR